MNPFRAGFFSVGEVDFKIPKKMNHIFDKIPYASCSLWLTSASITLITRLYWAKNSRKSPFLLKTQFTQNAVFGTSLWGCDMISRWVFIHYIWAEIWRKCSLGVWLRFVVAVFEKHFFAYFWLFLWRHFFEKIGKIEKKP